MSKLIVAFRNFASEPKNGISVVRSAYNFFPPYIQLSSSTLSLHLGFMLVLHF
jgi:hypothetical protein